MAEQSLKDKTAKGLFWGGISNGCQQLLSLLFGIMLARSLSQTDYGMFTMLIIFTTAASLLLDSGFTTALINKKDATDQDDNAVFWFSTGMGTILYALSFFAAPYIARLSDHPADRGRGLYGKAHAEDRRDVFAG